MVLILNSSIIIDGYIQAILYHLLLISDVAIKFLAPLQQLHFDFSVENAQNLLPNLELVQLSFG